MHARSPARSPGCAGRVCNPPAHPRPKGGVQCAGLKKYLRRKDLYLFFSNSKRALHTAHPLLGAGVQGCCTPSLHTRAAGRACTPAKDFAIKIARVSTRRNATQRDATRRNATHNATQRATRRATRRAFALAFARLQGFFVKTLAVGQGFFVKTLASRLRAFFYTRPISQFFNQKAARPEHISRDFLNDFWQLNRVGLRGNGI